MSMAGVRWVIIPVLVASAYSYAHLSMRTSVASMSGQPLIGGTLPLTGSGRYPAARRRLRQAVARSSRSHAGFALWQLFEFVVVDISHGAPSFNE